MKKGEVFIWGKHQQESFKSLKEVLGSRRVLGFFDPKMEVVLMVDASPVGLGAVLAQHKDDKWVVVSFASKSLTETEQKYCQTEREALAIVFGVERFKYYLFGRKFSLYTDCKALEFLFSERSKPCARIERWVLRIQSFSFKVVHKPGSQNIADCLSRLGASKNDSSIDKFCEFALWHIVEYSRPVAFSREEIRQESMSDKEIMTIKYSLETKTWDEEVQQYKPFASELCVVDDMLLRGQKIVIPRKLREKTLQLAHEGHQGMVAMKARLRSKVWWYGIDKEVETFVRACKECVLVSVPDPPEPLKTTKFPDEAWEAVALDFKGPLPSGEYLLVVIDYFSKYTIVEIMRSTTTVNLIAALRKMFSNFGPPISIRGDNGPQINCEEFKKFCHEFNVKLVFSTPYWPQANGEVERMNRTLGKRLQISRINKTDWKEDLQTYIMNYHATPHTITGKTPAELMLKRKIRDKLPGLAETIPISDEVNDNVITKKWKMKEYIDKKRKAKESDIREGDDVVIMNPKKKSKMDPNFNSEEFEVVHKNGGEVLVKSKEDGHMKKRNVTHLKKIVGSNLQQEVSQETQIQETENQNGEDTTSQQLMEKSNADTDRGASMSRPKRSAGIPARFLE